VVVVAVVVAVVVVETTDGRPRKGNIARVKHPLKLTMWCFFCTFQLSPEFLTLTDEIGRNEKLIKEFADEKKKIGGYFKQCLGEMSDTISTIDVKWH